MGAAWYCHVTRMMAMISLFLSLNCFALDAGTCLFDAELYADVLLHVSRH